MTKIGIIGLGNPLRKDDGIGIVLLNKLKQQKKKLGKNIELIDGGIGGMNLLHVLARFDIVVLIDAVDFQGAPGESHVFTVAQLQSKKTPDRFSTHESDFLNIICLSKELNELPRKIIIFAVQPQDVSFGTDLSEQLEKNLDGLLGSLQRQIHTLQ